MLGCTLRMGWDLGPSLLGSGSGGRHTAVDARAFTAGRKGVRKGAGSQVGLEEF